MGQEKKSLFAVGDMKAGHNKSHYKRVWKGWDWLCKVPNNIGQKFKILMVFLPLINYFVSFSCLA